MNDNPFKIIKPTEEPPKELKQEVMGSVKTLVLILRFVQLFVGDYSSAVMSFFKSNQKVNTKSSKSPNNDKSDDSPKDK